MTREEIIEQYPIALAEKEGKKIQYYYNGKWIDCIGSAIYGQEELRIKPEPTKRLPTIEEVEKWFLDNKVFVYKDVEAIVRICVISRYSETPIWTTNDDGFTISQFCEQLTHYDGTELYITEN